MRESAMVGEIRDSALELPEYVEIRCLSGQRHGRRRERRFAVETGSAQHRAGKEMSDRLQVTFVAQMRAC